MIKLKKFSNKLNNDDYNVDCKRRRRKKRGIKIKRKKLVYNKKRKFISITKKKISSPKPTEILKSNNFTPNSSIVRNLLNDSRGISKYMINYDLTEYTNESPSIINTTKQFFYDNTFDGINLDFKYEEPSINLEDLKNDEYSFNNDDTIVKSSNCSSGYLSD
jgi:hypothetical protein